MKNNRFFNSILHVCLVAMVILFHSGLRAQDYRLYGTASSDESFGAVLPLNDHYFVAGAVAGNGATDATVSKMKAATGMALAWTRMYRGPNGHQLTIHDIRESISGNLIVAGVRVRPPASGSTMSLFVMEISQSTGDLLQTRSIVLPDNENFVNVRIIRTEDDGSCFGSYVLLASMPSPFIEPLPHPIFLVELDQSLAPVWAYKYGTVGEDAHPTGIIAEPGGGAIIAGHLYHPVEKSFLMKINSAGTVTASNGYAPLSGGQFFFRNIVRATPTADIFCNATWVPSVGGFVQGGVQKIDGATLGVLSSKVHANPTADVILSGLAKIPKTTGSVYTGYYLPIAGGGFEPRLFKLSTAGLFQAQRDLGGTAAVNTDFLPIGASLTKVVVANGRTVPVGSGGHGLLDGWLGQMPATMDDVCGDDFPTTSANLPLSISAFSLTRADLELTTTVFCHPFTLTYNNNNVCGVSNKPGDPTADQPTTFEAPNPHGTSERSEGSSKQTALTFKLFPNPANETVEITFGEGSATTGQAIQIFDVTGKLVKEQTPARQNGATTIDIRDLPTGIFMVKIGNSGEQKLVKF